MKLLKILLLILISQSLYAQEYFITPKAVIGVYTPNEIDATIKDIRDNITFSDDTTTILDVKFFRTHSNLRYWWLSKWYLMDIFPKGGNVFMNNILTPWAANMFLNISDNGLRNKLDGSSSPNINLGLFTYTGGDSLMATIGFQNKVRIDPTSGAIHDGNALYCNVSKFEISSNSLPSNIWEFVGNEFTIEEFNTTGSQNLTTTDLIGYRFRFGRQSNYRYKYRYVYAYYSNLSDYSAANHIYTNAYHFYGKGNYPSFFGGRVEALNFKLSALNTAPATSTSAGTTGEIRIDANYIYICVATNTWKRVALNDTTW